MISIFTAATSFTGTCRVIPSISNNGKDESIVEIALWFEQVFVAPFLYRECHPRGARSGSPLLNACVPKYGEHHARHGLFPHWVNDVGRRRDAPTLRRHLYFYADSRDLERYDTLKKDLAVYRLAFGQARQEDLVRSMRALTDAEKVNGRDLRAVQINLSPFRRKYARAAALHDVRERADDKRWRRQLLQDARKLQGRFMEGDGKELWRPGAVRDLDRVLTWLDGPGSARNRRIEQEALAALVYLRNPYDDEFDKHRMMGLHDDATRLKSVAAKIRASHGA